jgi:anti-sigma B factor antagonist
VNIETRKKGDVVIVDFQGRLAIGVGDELLPALVEQLLGEGNRKILLNLSDMDYIDSNGLGELVQSVETLRRVASPAQAAGPRSQDSASDQSPSHVQRVRDRGRGAEGIRERGLAPILQL